MIRLSIGDTYLSDLVQLKTTDYFMRSCIQKFIEFAKTEEVLFFIAFSYVTHSIWMHQFIWLLKWKECQDEINIVIGHHTNHHVIPWRKLLHFPKKLLKPFFGKCKTSKSVTQWKEFQRKLEKNFRQSMLKFCFCT